VPGTRGTRPSWIFAMNSSIGMTVSCSRSATAVCSHVPNHHDEIEATREQERHISALGDLGEVGREKKAASTIRKAPASAPAAGRLQRQISRMAMNSSTEVISMVAETAIP